LTLRLNIIHSAGIGYATSIELARHGAKVYLACRTESKALAAIELMHTEAPDIKAGSLIWLPLDLIDLDSVVKAVETFMSQENKLDILGV
jgi:NAD(P)-dependent dehydrogenase (short-subunit alcohol dehydrogenase family)